MAILLDDQDPKFKDLSHAEQAYKHTVALLSAMDVQVPAGVAPIIVALKEFHQGKLDEATKAIQAYANELREKGKTLDEQTAKDIVHSAVERLAPEV